MHFLRQILLITAAILFAMHFVNAAKIRTSEDSGEYDIDQSAAMPLEIQKVLAQMQDTKLVRNKTYMQDLLKQMRKAFKKSTSKPRCAKCKTNSMRPN